MVNVLRYFEHDDEEITISGYKLDSVYFRGNNLGGRTCFKIYRNDNLFKVRLSYFIGLDWINDENVIHVSPKLNSNNQKIDYLRMLSYSLLHPDILNETEDLYHIDFEKPTIKVDQELDFLTPLLIVHFLQVMRLLVKKGLKKGYYRIEENLTSKVKGKIVTAKNFKANIVKNRPLKTICNLQEFGIDTYENRLLKKTLHFVQRYVSNQPSLKKSSIETIRFCLSPFELVKGDIEAHEFKAIYANPIYKEYTIAIKLAKLILQRFGYNMHAADKADQVNTPPFWIDMSRLFELYVLGKLKNRFKHEVKYHFRKKWNELDYLINTPTLKMIADAKYKKRYENTYSIDDIRQLSGYARISEVLRELEMKENEIVDCLIIYPDQTASDELSIDLKAEVIDGFISFYKTPIKLPVV